MSTEWMNCMGVGIDPLDHIGKNVEIKVDNKILKGKLELTDWWGDVPIIKVVAANADSEFFYSCDYWRFV